VEYGFQALPRGRIGKTSSRMRARLSALRVDQISAKSLSDEGRAMPPLAVRLREIWSASISVAPHACGWLHNVLLPLPMPPVSQSEW
jgi:hypothetical protein